MLPVLLLIRRAARGWLGVCALGAGRRAASGELDDDEDALRRDRRWFGLFVRVLTCVSMTSSRRVASSPGPGWTPGAIGHTGCMASSPDPGRTPGAIGHTGCVAGGPRHTTSGAMGHTDEGAAPLPASCIVCLTARGAALLARAFLGAEADEAGVALLLLSCVFFLSRLSFLSFLSFLSLMKCWATRAMRAAVSGRLPAAAAGAVAAALAFPLPEALPAPAKAAGVAGAVGPPAEAAGAAGAAWAPAARPAAASRSVTASAAAGCRGMASGSAASGGAARRG